MTRHFLTLIVLLCTAEASAQSDPWMLHWGDLPLSGEKSFYNDKQIPWQQTRDISLPRPPQQQFMWLRLSTKHLSGTAGLFHWVDQNCEIYESVMKNHKLNFSTPKPRFEFNKEDANQPPAKRENLTETQKSSVTPPKSTAKQPEVAPIAPEKLPIQDSSQVKAITPPANDNPIEAAANNPSTPPQKPNDVPSGQQPKPPEKGPIAVNAAEEVDR